jgi:hypothetical protein
LEKLTPHKDNAITTKKRLFTTNDLLEIIRQRQNSSC